MSNKLKAILGAMAGLALFVGIYLLLRHANMPVIKPQGPIARSEQHLMLIALFLAAFVVLPVYAMTAFFALKYRHTNKNARYSPNLDSNALYESLWWGIPLIIITILAVITWQSSNSLDPFRPVSAAAKPINVQVIAMQWKWLFIYPQQNIASVNFVEFPTGAPVEFEITSDAPMNSFWIPALGGQIYAMSGMATKLSLVAYKDGVYRGVSANISGDGFAGMKFNAQSTSQQEFANWVSRVQSSSKTFLNLDTYKQLAIPSMNNPVKYYSPIDQDLFGGVVKKFNGPIPTGYVEQR